MDDIQETLVILKITSFVSIIILIVLISKFLELCRQIKVLNLYVSSIVVMLEKHFKKTDAADTAPNPPIPSATHKPAQENK